MQNVNTAVEINVSVHFKTPTHERNGEKVSLMLEFNKSQHVVWKKSHARRPKKATLSTNATSVNTALALAASYKESGLPIKRRETDFCFGAEASG